MAGAEMEPVGRIGGARPPPRDLTWAGGQARNLVTNFFHVTKDLWNCMVLSGSDSSEEEEDLGARLKTSGEMSYSPAYR